MRIFLLSPASCRGRRGRMLLAASASFPLAVRLRSSGGAPLGDVFSFLSGLYFRGKLAYARRFARPPRRGGLAGEGVLVITPSDGLRSADSPVTALDLARFAAGDISLRDRRYCEALSASARALREAIGRRGEVVLLGSIASPKYVDLLTGVFGTRLVFPTAFVGRGDMSRGGLMLRCVEAGVELDYAPVLGAMRHGPRPPRLEPRSR